MAKTSGYGMDAKAARSPSKMPPKKSSPDSAKPGAQYNQGKGPASSGDRNKSSPDSGKPSSQHSGF